ncbi:MAG: sirohydrochlorin cobaltochelatase [Lachnospiraceae bacterium]|nr:sirohydrochlorin cobaltochelatase [Lachnospiraceae bacterium]
MKKAILIVSSGTSVLEALNETTNKLEKRLMDTYPDYKVCQAFSVQPIVNKMQAMYPGTYFNVQEMLEKLLEERVEELAVLPFYMIKGTENERLREVIKEYEDKFAKVVIAKPLFHIKEDYIKVLDAVLDAADMNEGEALMLVGHGTKHHDNTEYQNLEYTAYTQGRRNIFVATLEGYQKTNLLMRKLQLTGCENVRLMPLLLVIGKHAKVDIAGDGDSWKTKLIEAGYQVEVQMTGLGELDSIQDIFVEHLKEVFGA